METTTVLNPRKNYFTESEMSHLWAHQLRPQAHKSGANHYQFYFEGKTIYSYGGHFPIASLFGKKNEFVAITTRTYSNTTSGHIKTVKSAVSHFAPENKIYCSNPQLAVSGLHKTNLENFEQAAKKAAEKLATAKKPSIYFAEIANQKAMFDKYCKAFKVKTKKKDFPNLHIQPTGEEIEKIKKQAADSEKERMVTISIKRYGEDTYKKIKKYKYVGPAEKFIRSLGYAGPIQNDLVFNFSNMKCKINLDTMQTEILRPSGDILVSDTINGQYIKERFSGYTLKQAKAVFIRKYKLIKK